MSNRSKVTNSFMFVRYIELFILIVFGNQAFAATNNDSSSSSNQTVDPLLYVLIGILAFLWLMLIILLICCFFPRCPIAKRIKEKRVQREMRRSYAVNPVYVKDQIIKSYFDDQAQRVPRELSTSQTILDMLSPSKMLFTKRNSMAINSYSFQNDFRSQEHSVNSPPRSYRSESVIAKKQPLNLNKMSSSLVSQKFNDSIDKSNLSNYPGETQIITTYESKYLNDPKEALNELKMNAAPTNMEKKDSMATKSSMSYPSSRRGTFSKRASVFARRLSKFRNKNPKSDLNSVMSPSLFQLKRLSDFIVSPSESRVTSSIFTDADTSNSAYGKRNKRNPYNSIHDMNGLRKSSAFNLNTTPDKRAAKTNDHDDRDKDQQMVIDWLMRKCNNEEKQADSKALDNSKARRDSGFLLKSRSDSNTKKVMRRFSLSSKPFETCSVCEKRFDPKVLNQIDGTQNICDSCYSIWHPIEVKSLKSNNLNRSLSTIEGSVDEEDTKKQSYNANNKAPRHSFDSVITTNVTRFSNQQPMARSENNLDHIQSRMTKSMLSENSLLDQNQQIRANDLQSNLNESMLSVSRQSSLLRAPSIGVYKFNRTSVIPQSRLKRSRKKSILYN